LRKEKMQKKYSFTSKEQTSWVALTAYEGWPIVMVLESLDKVIISLLLL